MTRAEMYTAVTLLVDGTQEGIPSAEYVQSRLVDQFGRISATEILEVVEMYKMIVAIADHPGVSL